MLVLYPVLLPSKRTLQQFCDNTLSNPKYKIQFPCEEELPTSAVKLKNIGIPNTFPVSHFIIFLCWDTQNLFHLSFEFISSKFLNHFNSTRGIFFVKSKFLPNIKNTSTPIFLSTTISNKSPLLFQFTYKIFESFQLYPWNFFVKNTHQII